MPFFADLHIHSHYSLATSRELTPEYLHLWARRKGLGLLATGDFTHPAWLSELEEKLIPAADGFFALRKDLIIRQEEASGPEEPLFVLSAEISNVYKRNGKTRKVHNLLLTPDFDSARRIQHKLRLMGFNITSDGRPILGLDSRDLLELVLDIHPQAQLIPAHIWTPWFSALGAASGFDSIEECYADLSGHIHTVETGLSSDVPMNRLVRRLNPYHLISNSDAHSPDRLGRNANFFNCDKTYTGLVDALRTRRSETIDLFPQEGKYHYAGHRKCGVVMNPVEASQHDYHCPVCHRPLTPGVLDRVVQLASVSGEQHKGEYDPKFRYIIPLPELISEILHTGSGSKKVVGHYLRLLQSLGPELEILLNIPIEGISEKGGPALAEGIRRMRNRQVMIKEGYDGEYGQIKVFRPGESDAFIQDTGLFFMDWDSNPLPQRPFLDFDLSGLGFEAQSRVAEREENYHPSRLIMGEQSRAIHHQNGPAAVLAGPGTGKTYVLTQRIIRLLSSNPPPSGLVLAITFTTRAANEMLNRLKANAELSDAAGRYHVSTIHALGLSLIREFDNGNQKALMNETNQREVIGNLPGQSVKRFQRIKEAIGRIKNHAALPGDFEPDIQAAFRQYQDYLEQHNLIDYDDLVLRPLEMISGDSELKADLNKRFAYILVDEFQDVNRAQYELILALTHPEFKNLFVIGDPNQAIYGFRGAGKAIFDDFALDFQGCMYYRLSRSFRCPAHILGAAFGALGKPMDVEGTAEGSRVKIVQHPTDRSEAETIAREIDEATGGTRFFAHDSGVASQGGKAALSDFAILCRTAHQFDSITAALDHHALPWRHSAERNLLESGEIQSIIRTLNEIDAKTGSNESREPILSVVKRLATEAIPADDLLLLTTIAADFGSDYQAFLDFIALNAMNIEYHANEEAVTILTLHASKGLEFEQVFITGCEDGLIPYHLFDNQYSHPDEEARLLFVGMTRARTHLTLSYAGSRRLFSRVWKLPKSPFLKRIPGEYCSHITAKPPARADSGQMKLF